MDQTPQNPVDASLYDQDYFAAHCRGQDLVDQIGSGELHEIFRRAIRAANLKAGESVLDYGCGRGELVYECARMGCRVSGMDVSAAAIEWARKTVSTLPEENRRQVVLRTGHIDDIRLEAGSLDVIFMIDVLEHLYDWELDRLIPQFKNALKPGGRLIIQTPNLLYEKFFYPFKRVVEFPFTLIKELGRLIRRTGKRKNAREFFTKLFKFQFHDDPVYQKMHINVQTPRRLRKMLIKYGFRPRVSCVDHSKNILSLLAKRWMGRTIDAVACR